MSDGRLLDFEEMEVWQAGQDLAADVYEDFAKCRDFTFVDQIKRAAVSISNNIAKGAERSIKPDFARFLDIGKAQPGKLEACIASRSG